MDFIHGNYTWILKQEIFFSMLTYFLTLITAMPYGGIPAVKFRQECFYSSSGKLQDLYLMWITLILGVVVGDVSLCSYPSLFKGLSKPLQWLVQFTILLF